MSPDPALQTLVEATMPGGPLEHLPILVQRQVKQLYPELSKESGMLVNLMKAANAATTPGEENKSDQPSSTGTRQQPFDFTLPPRLKVWNIHHSACVQAKVKATVGLGHEKEKVADELDDLCDGSWHETMLKVGEDYYQVGNGYIEVVRDLQAKAITGLYHVPAADVRINLEDRIGNIHYEVRGGTVGNVNSATDGSTIMIRYGDREDFRRRHPGIDGGAGKGRRKLSELIHLREASSQNRWYGFPSWLAAIATIELTQALTQHQFDFHVNRGVPEFLLFLLGGRVDKPTWDKLTNAMQSFVGVGQSHKSGAFNLTDPEAKVQVERLAMDGIANGTFFRDMSETLAVSIVSAHRVPPSLAGIMIPGKMGATNELVNAILAFQALVIGPEQTSIETVLGNTLGNLRKNGGLSLRRKDFELKTIIDEMAETLEKLAPLDTIGRMKQQLPNATSQGRSPAEGLKE